MDTSLVTEDWYMFELGNEHISCREKDLYWSSTEHHACTLMQLARRDTWSKLWCQDGQSTHMHERAHAFYLTTCERYTWSKVN